MFFGVQAEHIALILPAYPIRWDFYGLFMGIWTLHGLQVGMLAGKLQNMFDVVFWIGFLCVCALSLSPCVCQRFTKEDLERHLAN